MILFIVQGSSGSLSFLQEMAFSDSSESTSNILWISRAELQQLNFDRIFPQLEEKGVLPKGITAIMKLKTASEKSNVLKKALEKKDDKDFRTFLGVVADEDDDRFLKPMTEFMAMISQYPKYKDYCHSVKTKLLGEGTYKSSYIAYRSCTFSCPK